MALNCIVVSGTGRIPEQIQLYLANARFFEVVAVVKDMNEAGKLTETHSIHYFLMDQETARQNFDVLLAWEADHPQTLIFGAEEVFFLENLKNDLSTILPDTREPQEVPVEHRETGSVDIGLEEGLVREIKAGTPANAAVNVVLKAAKAHFLARKPLPGSNSIFVRSDSRISRIRLGDLMFVEAQKDYVVFHTAEASYRTLNSMKKIERHLDGEEFFRIHRSFIVRLDKIHTIHTDEVLLDGTDAVVPIGPSYKNKLMKRLQLL